MYKNICYDYYTSPKCIYLEQVKTIYLKKYVLQRVVSEVVLEFRINIYYIEQYNSWF